jgi:hypothetical protein
MLIIVSHNFLEFFNVVAISVFLLFEVGEEVQQLPIYCQLKAGRDNALQ